MKLDLRSSNLPCMQPPVAAAAAAPAAAAASDELDSDDQDQSDKVLSADSFPVSNGGHRLDVQTTMRKTLQSCCYYQNLNPLWPCCRAESNSLIVQ